MKTLTLLFFIFFSSVIFSQESPGPSDELKDFSLSQCYPNPFNPSTKISFSISQPTFTQLKIYDVFGREITTLVNELLQEGSHSYQFNGKNLASGVYFYSLKAGNYSATKKMILTK